MRSIDMINRWFGKKGLTITMEQVIMIVAIILLMLALLAVYLKVGVKSDEAASSVGGSLIPR